MRKKLTLPKLQKILTLEEFHYIFSFYIGGLKPQLAFFFSVLKLQDSKSFQCSLKSQAVQRMYHKLFEEVCLRLKKDTQITQRLRLPRGLRSYEFSRVDKIDEEHRDKYQNYRQNYRSLKVYLSTYTLYCVRCGLIDFFILQSLGSLTHSFIKLT